SWVSVAFTPSMCSLCTLWQGFCLLCRVLPPNLRSHAAARPLFVARTAHPARLLPERLLDFLHRLRSVFGIAHLAGAQAAWHRHCRLLPCQNARTAGHVLCVARGTAAGAALYPHQSRPPS